VIRARHGGDPGDDVDAELDPWVLVVEPGAMSLFGFAVRHPATGGLAWTLSTTVRTLDEARGRAVTRSGRRYALGRRIDADGLPDEEARVAYALLVGPLLGRDPAKMLGGMHLGFAAAWQLSRKMARHLRLAPPPFEPEPVARFLDMHGERYRQFMRAKLGQ
jgi:hypothetical protein